MIEETCRKWREQLGAFVLGQLPKTEAAALRHHLDGCAECRQELRELRPMARLLPLADPERVVHKPIAPPQVETVLFSKIAEQKRRQRRVRTASSATLSIAAVVIAALLVVPMLRAPSEPGRDVAFGVVANVQADGRIVDQPWGTEIHLEVAGLSGRQTVWFEQPDGTRASAGSFQAVDGKPVDLVLSTAFKAKDAVALCVSPPEKPAVLRAPLTTA